MTVYLNRLFRWLFFVGLGVTALASLTPLPFPPDFQHSDKVLHLLTYAGLCTIGAIGYTRFEQRIGLVLFLPMYGSFIEALQELVPNRFGSLLDVLANTVGVAIAALAIWMWTKIRRGHRRPPEPRS